MQSVDERAFAGNAGCEALWPSVDETFVPLSRASEDIRDHRRRRLGDGQLAGGRFDLYPSCKRLMVDDIQAALSAVGLRLGMVRPTGSAIHLPPSQQNARVTEPAIECFTMIAVELV